MSAIKKNCSACNIIANYPSKCMLESGDENVYTMYHKFLSVGTTSIDKEAARNFAHDYAKQILEIWEKDNNNSIAKTINLAYQFDYIDDHKIEVAVSASINHEGKTQIITVASKKAANAFLNDLNKIANKHIRKLI